MRVRCIQDVIINNRVYFSKNRWYKSVVTRGHSIGSNPIPEVDFVYYIKSDLNVSVTFFNKKSKCFGDLYLFGSYFKTCEEYRDYRDELLNSLGI
jgi:hypothetical protein